MASQYYPDYKTEADSTKEKNEEQANLLNNDTLISEFRLDCQDRGFTAETVRRYCGIVRMFIDFMKEHSKNITQVDKHILRKFIHYRRENGINPKTISYDFTALSAFYGFMVFEEYQTTNPVLEVRKRYLTEYKLAKGESPRKLISVEQMSMLINSILNNRDRAVCLILAKTGLRRAELISLDMNDVNWRDQSIILKKGKFKKRTNRAVFFDDECARALKVWLSTRSRMVLNESNNALFVGEQGKRLNRNGIYTLVTKYAQAVGLHNPDSDRIEDHFSPHNFRHWFTTHLLRNGMSREYVQELRGDGRRDAIDIYHHIDKQDLRKAYLACIPKLGI